MLSRLAIIRHRSERTVRISLSILSLPLYMSPTPTSDPNCMTHLSNHHYLPLPPFQLGLYRVFKLRAVCVGDTVIRP